MKTWDYPLQENRIAEMTLLFLKEEKCGLFGFPAGQAGFNKLS
jgi:hypothetical protein